MDDWYQDSVIIHLIHRESTSYKAITYSCEDNLNNNALQLLAFTVMPSRIKLNLLVHALIIDVYFYIFL